MSEYDQWLLQQADIYMSDCTPTPVGVHQEPQDGEIATENIYNCEECEDHDCEYWGDYHAEQDEALLWGI